MRDASLVQISNGTGKLTEDWTGSTGWKLNGDELRVIRHDDTSCQPMM